MTTLGIDIGGTAIKVALVDGDGRAIFTRRSASYEKPNTETLVAALRDAVPGDLQGCLRVGLCVPGLLDPLHSAVTVSVNVPGLVGVPLMELVSRALGRVLPMPPRVVNDSHAAAHDLVLRRGLSGRVLVLSLGTGVGASVLDDGVPLHVDGTTPGHFGQLDVSLDEDPPIGPDGGAGGFEAYIGAATLRRRYGEPEDAFLSFTGNEPPLRALARAVRIAHAIYRPHHVILAGGIGLGIRPMLANLRSTIERSLTSLARAGWTLTCADDEFHAARGAALLARSAPG